VLEIIAEDNPSSNGVFLLEEKNFSSLDIFILINPIITIRMFTAEDFIRKGFLPDHIIPPLCSYTLANAYRNMSVSSYTSSPFQKKSKCCFHSIPKIKNFRRHFCIPNPLHQIILCQVIEDNWAEIYKHIKKSKISISYPIVSNNLKKNYQNIRSFERPVEIKDRKYVSAERSFDSRYVLIADVSRYFPTIDSHAIPWALHGKQYAKAHINDPSLLGNKIDKSVRNTQDGQTLGIPIGPDTSHFIAEIIGAAIDDLLKNHLGPKLQGWRAIDDFHLFFKTRSEAESALHILHQVFKEFELEINPEKTKILELPLPLEEHWVTELRSFKFRLTEKGQKGDLINYFSRAFSLSTEYPDASVLKYAIVRTHQEYIFPENWSLYESLLLKSIISEPSCIEIVTSIFHHWDFHGYSVDKKRIASVISEFVCFHSKFSHSFEISWALWLAKTLQIKIDKKAREAITESDDPIVALIALDLREQKLISGRMKTLKWEQYMHSSHLYEPHWLLAYEAYMKGWLPSKDGSDYLANDPFFSILKNHNVQFYDKTIHEIEYKGKMPDIEEKY
jgi:hypothetical protein